VLKLGLEQSGTLPLEGEAGLNSNLKRENEIAGNSTPFVIWIEDWTKPEEI
jgi:hypothetical protein